MRTVTISLEEYLALLEEIRQLKSTKAAYESNMQFHLVNKDKAEQHIRRIVDHLPVSPEMADKIYEELKFDLE
jgi:GrpB-like predicted nucleotidyltransferase (UPF0157 family)